MADKSNITLYTAQTANGVKISILLEELGLKYEIRTLDFSNNEQKSPWFLSINPNGRIPALTDTFTDGKTIRVFESGAIMQYLIDRYDTDHKVSYPRGSREYYEMNSWVFWQMGGLGPMQGQLNHFLRNSPQKIEYAITRYADETRRLYGTVDAQLRNSTSGYLVGDRCTIADIICWGWIACAYYSGVHLATEFPVLEEWVQRMLARPGVERGRHVPEPHTMLKYAKLSADEIDAQAAEDIRRMTTGVAASDGKD
ncbi:glutathione S-transferase [Xylaria longipes]|nr:glutathione S-transferase [Xylaria longipes]